MSYRRILVPVDDSPVSRLGLKAALQMARDSGAKVRLLHVVEEFGAFMTPDTGASIGPVLDSLRAAGKRTIARIERRARAAGIKPSTALVENFGGRVADTILDEVKRWRPDLVVMGTHGHTGIKHVLLGRVTERVLRAASCPVLTVPRRAPDAVPIAAGLFKQILCGIDFSPAADHAREWAMSLAQEADARLTVVHVLTSQLVPDAVLADQHLSVLAYQRLREDEAQRRIAEALPSTASSYCQVESTIVRGKPWREIVGIATAQQSDLIVLGVHGRGSVDLMFFGSTAHQVVRHASCPVLTLRQN